jgi:hypothetical protein
VRRRDAGHAAEPTRASRRCCKATGGAAGQTAESINALAEGSRAHGLRRHGAEERGDDAPHLQEITGDTFERILKLSADLASTGRGDLDTWVTVLAKAGTEPARRSAGGAQLGKLRSALKVAIQDAVDFNDKQRATRSCSTRSRARRRHGGGELSRPRAPARRHGEGVDAFLKEAVGTRSSTPTRAAPRSSSKALDHMTETFKSRVQAMKDA